MSRTILRDTIEVSEQHLMISTVRLPCDHGHGDTSLWFETMVFVADEDGEVISWHDTFCWRYERESQARIGHAIIAGVLQATGVDSELLGELLEAA